MYSKIKASKDYINNIINDPIDVAIILGSGLGGLVDAIEHKTIIKYKDIPNFPQVSVEGHKGNLIYGVLGDKNVLCMEGRFHYYEGYTMKEVTYPFFLFKELGINKMIVTNAAGGVNTDFNPGTLMIIDDFINFMGTNPLIGKNNEQFGPRFPDMSEPYSKNLIEKAKRIADELNIEYKEGVYAAFSGPYYETRAEIRMASVMGADAVGMSTVPETIVANYLGIETFGISCITNMATGIQTGKHSHEKVVEIANKSSATLCRWVKELVKSI